MRKTILAAAVLAAITVPAFADDVDSVTLYGVLDAGVGRVSNSLNFDPNFSASVNPTANANGAAAATGMFNGGMSPSRWGLKGNENIGNGLSAIFVLESGFNLPTGTVSNAAVSMAQNTAKGPNAVQDSAVSGQLFSRAAYAGLSSSQWGTVTIGRNPSLMYDLIPTYDAVKGAPQLFSPLGYSGSYGGGGATDDSRVDNSVKYKVKAGDFNFGALYKFGGVSGAFSAQSAFEATAGWDHGPFGVQASYQSFTDAFSISNTAGTITPQYGPNAGTKVVVPAGQVGASAYDTRAFMITARYTADTFGVRVGYEREEFNNPSNPAFDQVTSLFGQTVAAVQTNAYASAQKDLNVAWIGGDYSFTKALNLSVGYYHINQNDYTGGAGCSVETSKCSGNSQYYSALLDYSLSKRTDLYAGYMFNKVKDGLDVGFVNGNDSNSILGVGFRHRF